MSEPRGGGDGADGRERSVPTAEESWDRHTRILDLIEQIRLARARREQRKPERPSR